jgi:hypothetical protein
MLELPGDEDSECELNGIAKRLATPFSAARGPIRGGVTVAYIWSQVVRIVTLHEFYKNGRFLTAPLW